MEGKGQVYFYAYMDLKEESLEKVVICSVDAIRKLYSKKIHTPEKSNGDGTSLIGFNFNYIKMHDPYFYTCENFKIIKNKICKDKLIKKCNYWAELKKSNGEFLTYTTLTNSIPLIENNNTVIFKTKNEVQKFELQNIKKSLQVYLENEFEENISLKFDTDNKYFEKTL